MVVLSTACTVGVCTMTHEDTVLYSGHIVLLVLAVYLLLSAASAFTGNAAVCFDACGRLCRGIWLF